MNSEVRMLNVNDLGMRRGGIGIDVSLLGCRFLEMMERVLLLYAAVGGCWHELGDPKSSVSKAQYHLRIFRDSVCVQEIALL